MSKVMPGQDITAFRSNFPESHESEIASKAIAWPLTRNEERHDACSPMKLGSENWIQMGISEPAYTDMLSGFQKSSDSRRLTLPCYEHNSGEKKYLENPSRDPKDELSLHSSQWTLMSSNRSFDLEPNVKTPTQDVRYGGIGGYSSLQNLGVDQNHLNSFTNFPANTVMANLSQPHAVRPQPNVAATRNVATPGSSSWKIFGFNLNNNPLVSDLLGARSNANYQLESCSQPNPILNQSSEVIEGGQCIEPSKSTKSVESAPTSSEQEKGLQPSSQGAKDVPSKPLGGSTRSCTKVLLRCLINLFLLALYGNLFE